MSAEVTPDVLAGIVAAAIPGFVADVVAGRTVSTGALASLQVQPESTLNERLGLDNLVHTGSDGSAWAER